MTKVGNGRHVDVRAWAENIANAWLPIQTYGVTLILTCESKFPSQISNFDPSGVSKGGGSGCSSTPLNSNKTARSVAQWQLCL